MLSTRQIAAAASLTIAAAAIASPPSPPLFDITVIGGFPQSPAFGPLSMAQGLNNDGRVVGYGSITPSGTSGLSWQSGSLVNLGVPSGFDRSFGNSVNASGQIAGGALRSDGSASTALRWDGATMTKLGTLGGDFAAALGINDHGRIVGYASIAGNSANRAAYWENGAIHELSRPAWANSSIAHGISNAGHIVGLASGAAVSRPVMWHGGMLSELPIPSAARAGSAVAVNTHGQAVGTWEISTGLYAGALWQSGTRTDLGFLGSMQYTLPAAINDAGDIVGTAASSGGGFTGFLWHDGTLHDLRDLLTESFVGYEITSARAINDIGQIAAVAMVDGRQTAVLLTPIPSPGAGLLLLAAGIIAVRRSRAD